MNFVQTLYVDECKNPFVDGFGWVAPEYHLMGWTLSCLQLQKIYGNVEIYTNNSGAKLLIDILNLPYSKIHISHENFTLENKDLWALPKILTYSLQKEPFIHIDGDVFIFKQFNKILLKSELIAQNIEEATDYYHVTKNQIVSKLTYIPACVKDDFQNNFSIKAVNAGVLGSTNIDFIKEYTDLAFKYVNNNLNKLSLINADRFNVFFEQHLYYCLAKQRGLSIAVVLPEVINYNEYKNLSDFQEVPFNKTYLHLLGHFKRDEQTCIQMAVKLRYLYPEYYYKIVSLFSNINRKSFINFTKYENITDINSYLQFNESSKKMFYLDRTKSNFSGRIQHKFNQGKAIDLSALKYIINRETNNIKNVKIRSKANKDFDNFFSNLTNYSNELSIVNSKYLYGLDIAAADWYSTLFSDEDAILDKIVIKCNDNKIIESKFDWARLINKNKRDGIKYYNEFYFTEGQFYNLIVPEVYGGGLSFFDLDEVEKLMMDNLTNPVSIRDLVYKMREYVGIEVVNEYLSIYEKLLISLLKDLVSKKVVMPY